MDADRLTAVICGFVGAFWAATGWFKYGVWINKGPGPGFLPVVFGILTCILCIARLLKKDAKAEAVDIRAFKPLGAIIACTAAVYVIGFLAAAFLLMFLWLKKIENYSYKFSIGLSLGVTAATWLIFEYWLQVPFTYGLFKL